MMHSEAQQCSQTGRGAEQSIKLDWAGQQKPPAQISETIVTYDISRLQGDQCKLESYAVFTKLLGSGSLFSTEYKAVLLLINLHELDWQLGAKQ